MVPNLHSDFEALFARIKSPRSRKVAESLFSATAEDFVKTFKPGETEHTRNPETIDHEAAPKGHIE